MPAICCQIFACSTGRSRDAHAGDVPAGHRFLFSGHKIGYINERVFRYDTNEYLLLTVPLPFECETFATEAVPLAGIRVNVDILQLQELLMEIGEDELFQPSMAASGINSATLSEEILCAIERLLDVMDRPLDARILGKQIVREILYHVLLGPGAVRYWRW
jgi:hypothetical protein